MHLLRHCVAVVFIAGCGGLGGCSVSRPYPICFFNDSPASHDLPGVQADITRAVQQYSHDHGTVTFSPDRTWCIVRMKSWEHRELQKVWPEIACIGRRLGETQANPQLDVYHRCIEHMRAIFADSNYDRRPAPPGGAPRPGYLNCDCKP